MEAERRRTRFPLRLRGRRSRGLAGPIPALLLGWLLLVPLPVVGVEQIDSLLVAGRGRWQLLNIWATWCRPCVAETGALVRLHESYPAERFRLLGVSTDLALAPTVREARARVGAHRKSHRVPYPLFLYGGSTDALTEHFALGGSLPATILYDPTGKEAGRWERKLSSSDLARIRALLK